MANIQKNLANWKPSENLTSEVLAYYKHLIKKGKFEEAAAFISEVYPKETAYIMRQTTLRLLRMSVERELSLKELNSMKIELGLVIRKGIEGIVGGVRKFTTHVIADAVFRQNGITNAKLKATILEGTLNQFEDYIRGAMSQTQPEILQYIRKIQQEWIIRNQHIRHRSDMDRVLYESESEFRLKLRKQFPRCYEMMEEGKILKSRLYGKNMDQYRTYTLEEYTDFATRATILNVDRNSVEIAAHAKQHRVVEYYLRDSRPIKTEEREVCTHILGKKVHGYTLLALDDEAAEALGILSLHEARLQGAMFIHCRHSIRSVSDAFNEEVNKIIMLHRHSSMRLEKVS